MRADKRNPARHFSPPDPQLRFYLFYGPDEAGSRALADKLLAALKAEKKAIEAGLVRSDPALLADEAGAIGMFGVRDLLWIEPCGDEITDGVAALLEAPACESPAVAIAGNLRKNGKLLKLAENHTAALVHASYAPEGRALDQMVEDVGREYGLVPESGVADRLARALGANRAILAREMEKFSLYLDATPVSTKPLGHDTLDAVGAELAEEQFFAIGDAAMTGQVDWLGQLLGAMGANDTIPAIRAMQRRILQLAPMQARIAAGDSVSGVMASQGKALFWKDKPIVQQMLQRWTAERLTRLSDRLASLEMRLFLGNGPAEEEMAEEMLAIARVGRP